MVDYYRTCGFLLRIHMRMRGTNAPFKEIQIAIDMEI